jgi:anaerobic selenocysteine-containing dehydrogenase
MTRTTHRTCTICEACCGIDVTVDGERVVRVAGDPLDPFSRGHVCPKAVAMRGLQDDPDRLRRPMVRDGERWREASWDAALDAAAEGLLRVKAAHGAQAVGVYRGNPGIHDAGTLLSTGVLVGALGTRQVFSAGSLDTWPRFVQCTEMFGSPLRIPVPDVDLTAYFLALGANPVVSQGSAMTAPGIAERLQAVRARGGKLVVIDPRRSETAALADEHHFIRPGTDAALLLAMIAVLFDENRVRLGAAEGRVDGLDALAQAARGFAPERVAAACGIDAATIRRLARELSDAPSAIVYGRMGTSVQAFGALACWAIDALAILTGNLDRPGGLMWAQPAAPMNFAFEAGGLPVPLGRWKSRAAGREERFGDLPISALAEEIETPGEGQVRALLTVAGNPAHTAPNATRLARALGRLAFMVALDGYRNETTRHAHVILPPVGPLQRAHYDVLLRHVAVRNVAKWSPPALPRDADARDGWASALELARRLAGAGATPPAAFDAAVLRRLAQGALAASRWKDTLPIEHLLAAVGEQPGIERVIDALLRVGPYGDGCGREPGGLTLARLKAAPHGIDLGPLQPALPGIVATASGRIALAPARMLADLPRLAASLAGRDGDRLQLINRRDAHSMNSWLHNVAALARERDRCTVQIHPSDAAVRGIADGDPVELRSGVGRLQAPAELTDAVMPGVVSLPHGFGHQREADGMRVAAARPGANVNDVHDDLAFDEASGAIALFGVPVTVARAVRASGRAPSSDARAGTARDDRVAQPPPTR